MQKSMSKRLAKHVPKKFPKMLQKSPKRVPRGSQEASKKMSKIELQLKNLKILRPKSGPRNNLEKREPKSSKKTPKIKIRQPPARENPVPSSPPLGLSPPLRVCRSFHLQRPALGSASRHPPALLAGQTACEIFLSC